MSDGQREALKVLARSQTAPHRQVQRAEALLLAGDGVANAQIAQRLGVKAATVRAWRARFAEDGLAKLGKVRAGRGRKATIQQEKIDEIVELTRNSKPAGQTHWSCRTMAKQVGVSPATGAAGLGRARVEAAPGEVVQAVQRSAVRGETGRRGRLVPGPAGQVDRAVPGREILGAGAGSDPAVAADEEGPGPDDDL